LTRGDFRKTGDAAYVTQERALYRYDPSKRSWGSGAVRDRIRTVYLSQEFLAVATENRVYHFNPANFIFEPQPALPMLRGIRSIARLNGNTVCVTGMGLAFNATSPFNFNLSVYPSGITAGDNVFAFDYDGHVIMYSGDSFDLYHPERRLWSAIRVRNRPGTIERRGLHGWSEDGGHINVTEGIHSSLFGDATLRQQPTFVHNDDGELEIDPALTIANLTVNIHTSDLDGRTLDITIDNAATTLPPQKGFYYRGAEGDLLNRASYGVGDPGLAASRINPGVVAEGGSAVFTSAARTPNSDRHFLSATAGSGHLLSKTEWRRLGYQSSGIYPIEGVGEIRDIAASSVKMYVDGIPLQGSDYTYNPANRTVRLLRREKADPTSVIQISFSERWLPEDRFAFEPLPENHLGQYNFVEGAISPRSWMSARGGLMYIRDRVPVLGPETGPMVMAGLPVELRNGANRSLLILPEVAYDAQMGAHSAAVTAGAREGRAFGSYRGLWVEQNFHGTDRAYHSMLYNQINDEHEASIGYDLRSNLRAGWYQLHRRTDEGSLSHYELRSSYTGDGYIIPDVEMSVSSRITDYGSTDISRDRKETFMLRLADPSSRFLAETNRLHNMGYEFTWTEYQNNSGQSGRVVYGLTNVSPIAPLTFTLSGMYRLNPTGSHSLDDFNPSLAVSMSDLPRGFDINASQSAYIINLNAGGSEAVMLRTITTFFYPGEYTESMKNFAFYLGYADEAQSKAPPTTTAPIKYAFTTDSNTTDMRKLREIGLLYFPTENLLLSTFNAIFRHNNFSPTYTSHERAKLWLENGSSLESSLQISKGELHLHLHADALYEHRWTNGLLTGAGLFGARNSEDTLINIYTGPQFIVSQTLDLKHKFFRNIEHSHRLQIIANIDDVFKPDLTIYTTYIRLKMPPNISLAAEIGMSVEGLEKVTGRGGIYLYAGF